MLKKSFLLLAVIFMIAFSVFATIPQKINYQGYLTDNTSNPITTTTPLEITFKIYDTPTTSTALWEATYDVVVVNGKFNVMLGNPDKWGNPKAIPYTVFDDNVKYLGIKVATDPEMTPRKELVTVAYAYKAHNSQQLDGKPSSDFASSSHNHDSRYYKKSELNTNDGNVNQSGDPVSWYKIKDMPAGFADGTDNGGGDNLGNHTATQNIKLNNHYLSNDGGNEGLKVENDGDVILSKNFWLAGYVDAQGNIISRSGYIRTGSSAPSYIGAGDIYATDDLIANGYVRTGSPSSSYSNGDIASTDDIIADDDITADGTVYGNGTSSTYGVRGYGGTYGVYGSKGSNYGYLGHSTYGVHGHSVDGHGVYGYSTKTNAYGVYGYNPSNYGGGFRGKSGVYAVGTNYYGIWATGPNRAGYFQGNVFVSGTLTKGGGAFEIDHPLDPENKYLRHSFVESPDMKNIYDGIAELDQNGEAEVVLPAWFEALNRDFRYQLTCIGGFAQVYISEQISNNRFKIAGGKSGMKISWQVTGIRHDAFAEAHRIIVEENKAAIDRGKYLHPKEHNMPESAGINYEETQRIMKEVPAAEPSVPSFESEQQAEKASQHNN